MIGEFLNFIVSRSVVRTRNLPLMLDVLKERLVKQGFQHSGKMPDSVGMIILEEALRRAAEKESDHKPRSGEFLLQNEIASDSIMASFNGDAVADPWIKSMLLFHKLL